MNIRTVNFISGGGSTGQANPTPVPRIYRTTEEKKIMDELRQVAHVCFITNETQALQHRFMTP
ncbi:MAG: hypothetical protein ABIB72_02430 [Candidatus Falkowbacteria bacterium]